MNTSINLNVVAIEKEHNVHIDVVVFMMYFYNDFSKFEMNRSPEEKTGNKFVRLEPCIQVYIFTCYGGNSVFKR